MTEANGFTTSSKYFCIFKANQFKPSVLLSFAHFHCTITIGVVAATVCLTPSVLRTQRAASLPKIAILVDLISFSLIRIIVSYIYIQQIIKTTLQVLSATVLLHVPTVWTLTSAQVMIVLFNVSFDPYSTQSLKKFSCLFVRTEKFEFSDMPST